MINEDPSKPSKDGSGGVRRLAAAFKRVISRDRAPAPAEEPQIEESFERARNLPAAVEPPQLEPEFAARINVKVRPGAPQRNEWREIEAGFANLADGGMWPSLLDRLRGTDQSRQQFPSGRRYYEVALAGALSPVTRHLRAPHPEIGQALAGLPVLEAVHEAHTRDYMPAVILGRALLELGWAIRGSDSPGTVSAQMAAEAAPYFARAESVLEAFDPIEENSPMIAEARYKLVPGVEDGVDFLRDWYEDWADLDPSNPHMLMTHSAFLMPEWYGDLDEIETEARNAVNRAADGLGAGAYAFFWWRPLLADPAALAKLDSKLFVNGIIDTLSATMSQDLANRFAVLLYHLAHCPIEAEGPNAAQAAIAQRRLIDGFAKVLRGHLREIHLPLWPFDEDGARAAIGTAFRSELETGLVVKAGENGLQATVALEE